MLELILIFLLVLLYVALCDREAVRLNLTVDGGCMAKIGDVLVARIAPTNVAGSPAPVFQADWLEMGDSYDVTPAPDGLSATLVARASGTGNFVSVSAITKSGATLSEQVALPDVEVAVDEEAVALNLIVGA